ncbi:MAG: hypothetical protein IIT37_00290, partial [Bacteroidales bacterium]|nr:hypothetical protein [Bacteroidales bacterium]
DFGQETIDNGKLSDSRLLWCLGNYSRYIKQNAKRIAIKLSVAESPAGLMSSAFRNPDGSIVSVVINYSDREEILKFPRKVNGIYLTNDAAGCKLQSCSTNGKCVSVPPKSVVTVVMD